MKLLQFALFCILFSCIFCKAYSQEKDEASLVVSPDASLTDTTFILAVGARVDSTLSAFFRGDMEKASQYFDDSLRKENPPAILGRYRKELFEKMGTLGKQLSEELRSKDGFLWFIKTYETSKPGEVNKKLKKGKCEFQIAVGQDSLISGMFSREIKRLTKVPEYHFPEYIATDSVREFAANFGTGLWKVSGSINLPLRYGKYPAVLLLHDAGPLDRDGSYNAGKPLRDLGWALAAQGFAVLRYDKRTLTHIKQIDSLHIKITPKQEVLDDALEALKYLRTRRDILPDKIFILGHGLGGMLAPRVAQLDTSVAGIIVINAPARPLEDALLSHVRYVLSLDTITPEKSRKQVRTLERQTQNVKSPTLTIVTPDSLLPLGTPAAYWLELRGYNAPKLAATLAKPILVQHCERSYHIEKEDFLLWQTGLNARTESAKNATFKLYPDLNQLCIEGEGRSTPQELWSGGNVDEHVVDDIANWLKNLIK